MKRMVLVLVAAAALAPAAALAGTAQSSAGARADCTKLRATMGSTAFSQAYSTFGTCVSAYAPVEQQVTASAQATCTAEQADPNFASTHDGKTFAAYYATGKSGKDSFGKCVSTVAKANDKAEQQGRMNPAQTCRTLRTQLTASVFDQTYGKNANDRNAFGKCVSRTARAQAKNEVHASSACKAEQSDPSFAGAHNGQSFGQVYGTNADGSNAFGNCVSGSAKTASTAQEHAIAHAATVCKSAESADPASFKQRYKTFGSCVAAQAGNG